MSVSKFTETALAFPFSIDSSGSVAVSTDQKVIWNDRVKAVIGTALRQRVMRGDFGCRLNEIFWNTETFVKQNLEMFVRQSFERWLPKLDLNKVDISDVTDSGVVNINISYTLPNSTQDSTVVGIIAISGNQLASQENL